MVEFKKIDEYKSFEYADYFCDEHGTPNNNLPGMQWQNSFTETPQGTRVDIEIYFASEKDMQTIIEMGFETGFSMAQENLDELLKKIEIFSERVG